MSISSEDSPSPPNSVAYANTDLMSQSSGSASMSISSGDSPSPPNRRARADTDLMSQSSESASMSMSSEDTPFPLHEGTHADAGTLSESPESESASMPSSPPLYQDERADAMYESSESEYVSIPSSPPPYRVEHAETMHRLVRSASMPILSGPSPAPPRVEAHADTMTRSSRAAPMPIMSEAPPSPDRSAGAASMPLLSTAPPSQPHVEANADTIPRLYRAASVPIMTGPSAVPLPPDRPESTSSQHTQVPSSPRSVWSESTLQAWSPRSSSSESTLPDWNPETWYEGAIGPLQVQSPPDSPPWSPGSVSSGSTLVEPPFPQFLLGEPALRGPELGEPALGEPGIPEPGIPEPGPPEPEIPEPTHSRSESPERWFPVYPFDPIPGDEYSFNEFLYPDIQSRQLRTAVFHSSRSRWPEPVRTWSPLYGRSVSPSALIRWPAAEPRTFPRELPVSRASRLGWPAPAPPTWPPAPQRPVPESAPPTPQARECPEVPPPPPDRLVIAIAGPTSSGKTTLSKLLLYVFGNGEAEPGSGFTAVAIHQDDFFVPNNMPTGPQVCWAECFLEEWMGERLVTRTCMKKGFTVEEADRITPVLEDTLITEYRDVYPRRANAPDFDREVLDLQLRYGKNRDTRLIIDNYTLDIAIARARTSNLSSDLPEGERDEVKDFRFLLKRSRLDGHDIRAEEEGPRDPSTPIDGAASIKEEEDEKEGIDWEKLVPPVKEGELTMEERLERRIFSPYVADPTMPVHERNRDKPGYIKGPIEPNSLPPHYCFDYNPHSLQCPELPQHCRQLLLPIILVRAQVHHWITDVVKLNNNVGFPGLNFIQGKFRGLAFVEGFTILEPAEIDPAAEPRDYDLSLFLSATREDTRKRRFERPEYNKPVMKGYMTWRERSYFDGVAWPAFIEEHLWIFDNVTPEQAKKGLIPDENFENVSKLAKDRNVVVRPGEMGIKETVQWAADAMMHDFGMKEMHARNEWVKLKREENAAVMAAKDAEKKAEEERYQKFLAEVFDMDAYLADGENAEPLRNQIDEGAVVRERNIPAYDLTEMCRLEREEWAYLDRDDLHSRTEDETADPFGGRLEPAGNQNEHPVEENAHVQNENGQIEEEIEEEIKDAGPWWDLDGDDFVDGIQYEDFVKNMLGDGNTDDVELEDAAWAIV
ncbi:hypothetical protein V496_09856 [Pseudogymnoascus sp. VKM F-4515 (FW-2607)]|nr:hypothetical protein V496_09856 [Pseudogymnoascus sp. VKM F-4515 (FW-2607)]KFY88767.1 hypothetical protein V498_06674 [Pseudogymnoascus sp. VKM F-4517 (FW-2822)]